MSARTHIAIEPDVLAILKRATIDERTLTLPPERLDPAMYKRVNKIIEAAGGKWNRGAARHVFDGDPRAALGMAMEKGEIVNEKNLFQSFYTPDDLAAEVVAYADLKDGQIVLEPSAGHGALADQCVLAGMAHDAVECVELDPKAVAVLEEKGFHVIKADFLAVPPQPIYDAVIMNPPFTKGQDIAHVTHALKFVAPGGKLVAVMSPGWQTATTQAASKFRGLVDYRSTIKLVEAGAFKESGTNVATVILVVDVEAAKPKLTASAAAKPGGIKAKITPLSLKDRMRAMQDRQRSSLSGSDG